MIKERGERESWSGKTSELTGKKKYLLIVLPNRQVFSDAMETQLLVPEFSLVEKCFKP